MSTFSPSRNTFSCKKKCSNAILLHLISAKEYTVFVYRNIKKHFYNVVKDVVFVLTQFYNVVKDVVRVLTQC